MEYKPNSPAKQLHDALSGARHALDRMAMVGLPAHVLSDAEDALEALTNYAYALPDEIPNGLIEMRQCLDCPHYVRTMDPEPYGDRTVMREAKTCQVRDALDCPAVQECGYTNDVLLMDIPDFLKRQAE